METDRKDKMSYLSQKLLDFDQFSHTLNMRFGKFGESLPSKMGAFCSIMLYILLISYTGYKMDIMFNRKNEDVTSALHEDYYDESYIF